MIEEPFFGKNIKEAIRVIKGLFKKEEHILDCLFCHNKLKITDTMHRENKHNDSFSWIFFVKCPNCKCRGPEAKNYTEALELWNDREK